MPQILWTFSVWLESVAILPQLFMLQRTGEAETITTHYLFALGFYRTLYIPNWLYRYFAEGYVDPIPWLAGTIQTILYSDFFWIYYTKSVIPVSTSPPFPLNIIPRIHKLYANGPFPSRVLQGKKFNLPV